MTTVKYYLARFVKWFVCTSVSVFVGDWNKGFGEMEVSLTRESDVINHFSCRVVSCLRRNGKLMAWPFDPSQDRGKTMGVPLHKPWA